jgi:hypothetical protein
MLAKGKEHKKQKERDVQKRYKELFPGGFAFAPPGHGPEGAGPEGPGDRGERRLEERLAALEADLARLGAHLERLGSAMERVRARQAPRAEGTDAERTQRRQARERIREAMRGGEQRVVPETYLLPEGKREALTQLMIRSDVPIRVRPVEGGLEVHATPPQHEIIRGFIRIIDPPKDRGSSAADPENAEKEFALAYDFDGPDDDADEDRWDAAFEFEFGGWNDDGDEDTDDEEDDGDDDEEDEDEEDAQESHAAPQPCTELGSLMERLTAGVAEHVPGVLERIGLMNEAAIQQAADHAHRQAMEGVEKGMLEAALATRELVRTLEGQARRFDEQARAVERQGRAEEERVRECERNADHAEEHANQMEEIAGEADEQARAAAQDTVQRLRQQTQTLRQQAEAVQRRAEALEVEAERMRESAAALRDAARVLQERMASSAGAR